MKIGLISDTHGEDIWKIQQVLSNDLIIILGDFGFTGQNLTKLNKLLSKENKTLLFVDGNHENFKKVNTCKTKTLFNGTVDIYSSNIYRLKRGEVYTINDKKFLCFGGAYSIDRAYRTLGQSWFLEEEYNENEKNKLEDAIIKNNYQFDYILTHDCPSSIVSKIHYLDEYILPPSKTNTLLENLYKSCKYEKWFFGHHHIDIRFNNLIGLYNDNYILEI